MRIEWADSARADFDKAIAYMMDRSPKGARRVGEAILQSISLLERFPQLAPKSKHRGLRQLSVPRTPYVVVYRPHEDRVEVRAVIHGKQKRRK